MPVAQSKDTLSSALGEGNHTHWLSVQNQQLMNFFCLDLSELFWIFSPYDNKSNLSFIGYSWKHEWNGMRKKNLCQIF